MPIAEMRMSCVTPDLKAGSRGNGIVCQHYKSTALAGKLACEEYSLRRKDRSTVAGAFAPLALKRIVTH